MGFRVHLASDSYSVEPGVAASVGLDVTNDGSSPIKVEVQAEGIDPEWVAIPVPVIEVAGGETVSERLYLKPPREPESLAGSYPFALRISAVDGEEKRTLPCSLEVKPFHNVSIDVQPRRGLVSLVARQTVFQVTVMNLGNVEHTLKLFATDHEEIFSYEFDHEQVTVAPGAQRTVAVTVTANKPPLMANARLQQFTVSCRSLDDKTIATATHGQVEQRALVPPGILTLGLLLVFILGAFIVLMPRKPTVDTLSVTPDKLYLGDAFTVSWTSSHAKSVRIIVDGADYEDLSPSGSKSFSPDKEGDIHVEVFAMNGQRAGDPKTRLVAVRQRPVPPEPRILEFVIDPTDLTVDQTFRVSYRLSESVTDAILYPTNLKLDPRQDSVEVVAKIAGEYDYKIVANNAAGQTTEQSVHVKVVKGSKASIIVFRSDKAVVDPLNGLITLEWQTLNSYRRELVYDKVTVPLDEESGKRQFSIDHQTTFTLRVWDADGATAEKTVTISTGFGDTFPTSTTSGGG